ncbi:hypothetical protein L3X16_05075 [Pseudomonas stutzeri]|nr:hypothetical protein [Stutzerimonas stutzeri]
MDESSTFLEGDFADRSLAPCSPTNQKFWFAAMRQKVEHDTQHTGRAQDIPPRAIPRAE